MIQTQSRLKMTCDKCGEIIEHFYTNGTPQEYNKINSETGILVKTGYDDLGEMRTKTVHICELCFSEFINKHKIQIDMTVYNSKFLDTFRKKLKESSRDFKATFESYVLNEKVEKPKNIQIKPDEDLTFEEIVLKKTPVQKISQPEPERVKRKYTKKIKTETSPPTPVKKPLQAATQQQDAPVKRGRGRPRKNPL